MSYQFSRRAAVKNGTLLFLGGSALPAANVRASVPGDDPHFFIFVNLFPGADHTHLFDARSLNLTAAGLQQNYHGREPALWTGSNGTSTLACALTEPLTVHRDVFSVINGVHMSSFDGHEQNQNMLLTGSPFGGDSFIPFLNQGQAAPLDAVSLQDLFGVTIGNNGGTLSASGSSLAALSEVFKKVPDAGAGASLRDLMSSRYQSSGGGGLAKGIGQMRAGYDGSASVLSKMKQVVLDPSARGGVPINLQVVGQFFKLGLTRSLMLGIAGDYDAHAGSTAKQQPQVFTETVRQLAELFTFLKTTDFAAGKKLIDVTTVLVGSEFSRTMRQQGAPIGATGTDHNSLNNSFIIGGRGIKPGQVIGASDLTEVDDNKAFTKVSGAHRERDPLLLKTMGLPFDFTTFAPHAVLPDTYDAKDYLQVGAVTNTIYKLFGLDDRQVPYRRFSQGGETVPILKPLLS